MIYVWAFVIGGLICVIGQLLMDVFKQTPAHTMVILVCIGAVLGGLGWYQKLVEFAGTGATVPITSFGNALVQGAMSHTSDHGFIGIITGIFEMTSAGISASLIFGFIGSLLFKSKG